MFGPFLVKTKPSFMSCLRIFILKARVPPIESSIKLALEGDKTLGGACSDLVVNTSANISALEQDDAEYLQISFQVTVFTQ